ncbi:hypothetical protein ADILRU_0383 [Leifsonia rubra CMS 76R]|nr:hypothetical protein ADILRU_0383 [Leifsonia rubra CMS 76R]
MAFLSKVNTVVLPLLRGCHENDTASRISTALGRFFDTE